MTLNKTKCDGFTLLEMLLVMVIVSSIIIMFLTYTTTKTDETKRDVTVMQYEQILNAGLAYYINNSTWPTDIGVLSTNKYLPNKTINNSWGQGYTFYQDLTAGTFSICSTITGRQVGATYTSTMHANIIAGRLPMAYVASGACPANPAPYTTPPPALAICASTTCAVVSTVNIPGQNLNNARSVNFAGLYRNGACVPAPVCPNPYSAANPNGMKPAIMVVPVSVSGNYYGGTNVYPLSSFTAYAVGNLNSLNDPTTTPAKCTPTPPTQTAICDKANAGDALLTTGTFWRVCLNVVTEKGTISSTPPSVWQYTSGTIMAITRCVPYNEPAGSGFNVFQSY